MQKLQVSEDDLEKRMWKIALGFIVFAGLSLLLIFKAGDKVDMGGEKHDMETHAPAAATPATAPTASAAK